MSEKRPSLSEKIYNLLLLAYPREFRRTFGEEMRQTFRSSMRSGSGISWGMVLRDWASSVMRERMSAMKTSSMAMCVAALLVGLFATAVDFANDEVQSTVLVALAGCFVLALLQPRGAWRWALLVGLCLPLGHFLGPVFGWHPRIAPQPNNFATLIVLVPAFIGAYMGVALRFASRSMTPHS